VSHTLDQTAGGDRRRPGDHHLVEDAGRVGQDHEHPTADIALQVETEGLDQTERDGRHQNHARNPGWRHERQQEIGYDQPQ